MSTQSAASDPQSVDEGAEGRARHVDLDNHDDPPDPQQQPHKYRGTAREGWCHHPDCGNHITQTAGTAGADPRNSQEYGHSDDCPYHIHR